MKSWCDDVGVTCEILAEYQHCQHNNFSRLWSKIWRKAEKFSLKSFVCHVFPCKTIETLRYDNDNGDDKVSTNDSEGRLTYTAATYVTGTNALPLGQNLNSKLLLIKKHT